MESLNLDITLPQLQDNWGGAQYPPSFYQDNQNHSSMSLQTLKEKINSMKNPQSVIQKAQSGLEQQTQQKLMLANEAERKAQQKYQLIEQEKQRLEELDKQLTQRSNQLKEYENELITQQQKVTHDLQMAGARYKQQLSSEIETIRTQKLQYEQQFAKERAEKEQQLHNLQQELNTTQQSIQNITQQFSDVQSTRLSQDRLSKQCYEQIQNSHNDVTQQILRQDFLMENSRQLSQSLLNEIQENNNTLTGQCIQLIPQIKSNPAKIEEQNSVPSITMLTDNGQLTQTQKSIQDASRRQSHIESELSSNISISINDKPNPQSPDGNMMPKVEPSEYQIPKDLKNIAEPVPVAEWARGELLQRCVLATYATDADKFFVVQNKSTVQDLFGIKNHPFDMKARQTQNWGKDKLSQKEIDQYNSNK